MYEGVKTFLFSDQLSQSHFNIKKLGVVPYHSSIELSTFF